MNPKGLAKTIRTKLPGGGSGPLLTFFLYALGIVEGFIILVAGVLAWAGVIAPWMVVILMLVGCGMFIFVVQKVSGLADRHPENLMLTPVTETHYLAILQERTRGDSILGEVELPSDVIDAEVEVLGEEQSKDTTLPAQMDARRRQKKLKASEQKGIEQKVDPPAGAGPKKEGDQ